MTERPPEVDAQLDDATLAQFTFKGGIVRQVACAVAKAFVDSPSGLVWADEVQLPELGSDDKNVVGLAWRNLARWDMIERREGATDHRRSRRAGRKGGVVWLYQTKSLSLLKTFLARNGEPRKEKCEQMDLLVDQSQKTT